MTRKLHPHQQIAGIPGLTVEDFWIWAYSDLLSTNVRAAFAEFLVGFALGRLNRPRVVGDTGYFIYRDKTVEIKAAAYTQSWQQTKKSRVNFDIARKKTWDPATNTQSKTATRSADCYVFALFTYENFEDKQAAVSHFLELTNWQFYVIPTKLIEQKLGSSKTVGLRWLETHSEPDGCVQFSDLKRRIDLVLGFKE